MTNATTIIEIEKFVTKRGCIFVRNFPDTVSTVFFSPNWYVGNVYNAKVTCENSTNRPTNTSHNRALP